MMVRHVVVVATRQALEYTLRRFRLRSDVQLRQGVLSDEYQVSSPLA
jgi:hypothetical protein